MESYLENATLDYDLNALSISISMLLLIIVLAY